MRLTVPRGWIVGATGREAARIDNPDGTTTHRYQQDDVHDFTWTTSPDYVEHRQRFEHPGLPAVDMRLLLQPEHAGQEDRHFAATAAALRHYGEWYGPYPYGHITVIDPAYQSGAGGHGVPDAVHRRHALAGAAPERTSPEAVTVHEAGHQFWYGIVGNNEFEHAWLDEGLNTFSEERVQSIAFQPNYRVERFFGGFVPWQFRDMPLSRATDGGGLNGYRPAAERDDPSMPSFRYWPGTHAAHHLQQDRAVAAHAGALPRLGDAAADPGHVLRTLEVPPPQAGGLLRRRQRGQQAGSDVVLRPGVSQLERRSTTASSA